MRHKQAPSVFDPSPRNLLAALGMVAGTALSAVASLAVSSVVGAVSSGSDARVVAARLAFALVVSVVAALAAFLLGSWLPMARAMDAEVAASVRSVDQIAHMSQRAFARHDTGHHLNLVTSASFGFGDARVAMSVNTLGGALSVLAVVSCAALVSPWLAVLFVLLAPIYLLLVDVPSERAHEAQKDMLAHREAWLDEGRSLVENKRSIAAARAGVFFESRFSHASEDYLARSLCLGYWTGMANNLPAAASGVFQVVAVMVTGLLVGAARPDALVAAYLLASLLQGPLAQLCLLRSAVRSNRVNVELVRGLASEAAEPSGFEGLLAARGPLARLDGTLYATPDRAPGHLLFHVRDLVIPKGSLVVVKGENGSGKSMLLDFLAAFSDPDDLDGTARLDESLRHAAYLTYPVPLVTGTFEDNLLGHAADPEMIELLGMEDLVGKEIDASAVNLSFGERQKLGLLRVLSMGSDVLLLDEPLTNLDRETSERLCAHLACLKREKTVVAVMHSADLDAAADLVLTIRDHELTRERGGHHVPA